MDPIENNSELRQLQRRSWTVLVIVAIACTGLSVMAMLGGSLLPGVLLLLFFSLALWLIYLGISWARWMLIILASGLGIVSIISSVAELVMSFADLQSLLFALSSSLLIVIGATLFGSETLRELAEVRRNHRQILTWQTVSTTRAGNSPAVSLQSKDLMIRQQLGKLSARLVFATSAVSWLLFVAGLGWLWVEGTDAMTEALQEARASRLGLLSLLWIMVYLALAAYVAATILIAYLMVFFAPFVLTLPLTLLMALSWKQPLKILILRPFNRSDVSRALRQVLREEVSPLGHCYTLADANIRTSPIQRLPLLYGQLTFLTFRAHKITSAYQLAALVKTMNRRVLRNINWAVSRHKLFPVASVDAGWKACVQKLVAECDVVIMDLSDMSENIQWELNLLYDTAAVKYTVFLVEQGQADRAKGAYRKACTTATEVPSLITYDESGLTTANDLRDKIVSIVGKNKTT